MFLDYLHQPAIIDNSYFNLSGCKLSTVWDSNIRHAINFSYLNHKFSYLPEGDQLVLAPSSHIQESIKLILTKERNCSIQKVMHKILAKKFNGWKIVRFIEFHGDVVMCDHACMLCLCHTLCGNCKPSCWHRWQNGIQRTTEMQWCLMKFGNDMLNVTGSCLSLNVRRLL